MTPNHPAGAEDSKRLDFLQFLTDQKRYSGKVILRNSTTGRGWRLHESSEGYDSVREAIDVYMKEDNHMTPNHPAGANPAQE